MIDFLVGVGLAVGWLVLVCAPFPHPPRGETPEHGSGGG
jgi:hypothetical protein